MDLFRSWAHFEDGVFEKNHRFSNGLVPLLIWKLGDELELRSLLETAWQNRRLAFASDVSIARAFLNPRCLDQPSWGDPGVGCVGVCRGKGTPHVAMWQVMPG